jgi:hypothetical protein
VKKRGYKRKAIYSLPAWIGIVAVSLQINAIPLDYFLFRLNQDHIVQTECERKVPHCNGHCFLMKQIKKTDNAENDKRSERFSAPLDGQFLQSAENIFMLSMPASHQTTPISLGSRILTGFPTTLLQPPRSA